VSDFAAIFTFCVSLSFALISHNDVKIFLNAGAWEESEKKVDQKLQKVINYVAILRELNEL
jgi:hypothetical protein